MWWIILLVILFLICLISLLRVRLCLAYDKELTVKLKVLCIPITLFPQKQKRIRAKDYSIKELQKKQRKQNKQKPKKKKKAEKPKEEAKGTGEKITEILDLVKIVLNNVLSPFGRYLRLEIAKIHVRIGTGDPAKTAVYYGLASQSVAYIVEFLSNVTNVSVKNKKSISVVPDFTSESSDAVINITFGLRVWHAVSLAIKFYLGYNELTENKNAKKQEE